MDSAGPRSAKPYHAVRSYRTIWYCITELIVEDGALDFAEVVLAADHRGRFADRGVGVLEAVAGEHGDDALRLRVALDRRQSVGEQARHRGGRGGLAEDADAARQPVVGVDDLGVGDGGDAPARAGEGAHRL